MTAAKAATTDPYHKSNAAAATPRLQATMLRPSIVPRRASVPVLTEDEQRSEATNATGSAFAAFTSEVDESPLLRSYSAARRRALEREAEQASLSDEYDAGLAYGADLRRRFLSPRAHPSYPPSVSGRDRRSALSVVHHRHS